MEKQPPTVTAIRWLARLSSLVVIFVLGLFLFGGNEQQTFGDTLEILGFIFFPVGVIAGLIFAWKHEMGGGLLAIASLAAFYQWHYSRAGSWPAGPWFLIFTAPAFIFLAAYFVEKMSRQTAS